MSPALGPKIFSCWPGRSREIIKALPLTVLANRFDLQTRRTCLDTTIFYEMERPNVPQL